MVLLWLNFHNDTNDSFLKTLTAVRCVFSYIPIQNVQVSITAQTKQNEQEPSRSASNIRINRSSRKPPAPSELH